MRHLDGNIAYDRFIHYILTNTSPDLEKLNRPQRQGGQKEGGEAEQSRGENCIENEA